MSSNTAYLSINRKWFDETKKKALETAKESSGEEDPEWLDWNELPISIDECYFEESEGGLRLTVVAPENQQSISFVMTVPIDSELMTQIIQHAVKQYNKIKATFETLK